jgi:hypothetical protein
MARTYVAKVNHHVHYFDSVDSVPLPGTITAIGSTNGGIVLRIGRSGITKGTGATGILREPFNHSATKANTWSPY